MADSHHEADTSLLGTLRLARQRDAALTIRELASLVALLLDAGYETTIGQTALAVLALLEHPEQWRFLVNRPEHVPGAVEELLRYAPVVPISFTRVAQIDNSAWPTVGVDMDRVGVSSEDTTGYVTSEVVTVTIDGVQLEQMFESNVCALGGDSGGPALRGTTALGLLSGGTDETVCNSDSSGTYRNYFMPVQRVLNARGLHVY
ncbi:trypsin-like serine protease [Streptomyces asiaticus]|uniref:trypsin-like serine protease n=1 Tax=Streptomyces asiaticus TaxID=114695 RepID=UPI00381E0795